MTEPACNRAHSTPAAIGRVVDIVPEIMETNACNTRPADRSFGAPWRSSQGAEPSTVWLKTKPSVARREEAFWPRSVIPSRPASTLDFLEFSLRWRIEPPACLLPPPCPSRWPNGTYIFRKLVGQRGPDGT